ncbi:MAG: IclR family transcriptional regulator domain-containing protein, partial [Acidimicrobiales bacterium]
SMGRVLLAGLDPAVLDAYLRRVDLVALTSRTITDAEILRGVLAAVAGRGYALVDQELEDGLRSIAVPVIDRHGRASAAINVSVHASRTTLDGLRRRVLPRLQVTAARISDDLRGYPDATKTEGAAR